VVALILVVSLLPGLGVVSAQNLSGNVPATLQGAVTGFDQDGNRMPLSWVRINAFGQRFNMTGYTGLNGLYVMVLPPGAYNISAVLKGYVTSSTNITVASGQFLLLDFILRSQLAVNPAPVNTNIRETVSAELNFPNSIPCSKLDLLL